MWVLLPIFTPMALLLIHAGTSKGIAQDVFNLKYPKQIL